MKLALKISDSAVGEPCGICAVAHEPQLLAVLGLVEVSGDVSAYL